MNTMNTFVVVQYSSGKYDVIPEWADVEQFWPHIASGTRDAMIALRINLETELDAKRKEREDKVLNAWDRRLPKTMLLFKRANKTPDLPIVNEISDNIIGDGEYFAKLKKLLA